MEFRELAWAQQLHRMKLQYGDAATATERSLPNYPGESLRQVIEASKHPHNLEPLLLTLAREENAATRARFAENQGELVLIQKVLSKDPIAEDRQVAVMGASAVVDAADGICYPASDACISYEVWLRVEMLDILSTMLREGAVSSLTPDMAARLVADLLDLHTDPTQHELLQLYAFRAAHQAAKHLHAARPALLADGSLISAAAAALSSATRQPRPASSPLNDPLQLLGVLAAAAEFLYMCVLCDLSGGACSTRLPTAAPAPGQVLAGCEKVPDMAPYAEAGLMPLLARAVEDAWALLCQRNAACQAAASTVEAAVSAGEAAASAEAAGAAGMSGDAAAPQASSSSASHAAAGSSNAAEHREQHAAAPSSALAQALKAVESPGLTYETNWQMYQAVAFEGPAVPQLARVVIEFGCSMLQLMAVQLGGGGALAPPELLLHASSSKTGANWPATETLQQMAASDDDMLLASTAKQMLSMADKQQGQQHMALMAREGHRALIDAVFARRCSQCNVLEGQGVAHKRCANCQRTLYCSVQCQKQHWKAGHKAVCQKMV